MANIDLLIFTYQAVVPEIKKETGGTNCLASKLIEESSLADLFALEQDLVHMFTEIPSIERNIHFLFNAKVFLQINDEEKITIEMATKAINSLKKVKEINPNIDTDSCIEDLIINIDSMVSESSIDELFQWAKLINSIPQFLSSHDNFLPMLSIRIKSIMWGLIQTDNMVGHLELAKTLAKCMAYRDIELSDISEVVIDQCLDFIETNNDFSKIEATLGNLVAPDVENSKELVKILLSLEGISKDSAKRLGEIREKLGVNENEKADPVLEVRMNQVQLLDDVELKDKVLYSQQANENGVEALVKEGSLMSGLPVAVKIYTFEERSSRELYIAEVEILKSLSGQKKCFLNYYGSFLKENSLFVITELCERTLADDLIFRKNNNKPYTIAERLNIMNELLEGFVMMYNRKIHHQDIKPANIMFTAAGAIKIIDFNAVVALTGEDNADRTYEVCIRGTRNWMSPEKLKSYSENPAEGKVKKPGKSDVFSLGLVFLSLFTFDDLTGKNLLENNESLLKLANEKVDNKPCSSLIVKMLNSDPEKRPSFRKAFADMPGIATKAN